MKKICIVLTAVLMIVGNNLNVFTAETTDALPFLRMGIGSRALAMGGAFTSVSDDASAIFYNPGGIANLQQKEVLTMYSSLSLDRSLNTFGFVIPTGIGSFGMSIINSGVTGIKGYDENKQFTGDFSYQANAIFLSYANKLQENISAGLNVKVIQDTLKNISRNGFGLDFGVIANPLKQFSIGLKMQDIAASMDKDVPPISISLGISYKFFDDALLLALDLNKIADKDNPKIRFGAEYKLAEILSFATGVNDSNISFGINFYLSIFYLSYAYTTDNFKISDRQHISLGIKF